jgi:hypothetical protein
MAPTPDWVKQLKPSGAQGHELLAAERAGSNVPVPQLEELLHTKEVIERTDRFERALAREKRLRILKKQHNWNLEEFRTATELIGEPGPYGLHDSMFKVCLLSKHPRQVVNINRLHLESKVHRSSKKSGSLWPTTTRSLDATLKLNLATVPTSADWKPQPHGIRMTRHSPFTLPT